MGAEQFFTVSLGRNPHQAFDNAVRDAQWNHGHAGYTGTIAEKREFKFLGPVSTPHWEKVPIWFERELAKRLPQTFPPTRLPGKAIPHPYREMVRRLADTYVDKWGPAICYEVTGRERLRTKDARGRHKTMDNVYVFCGWASA